MYDKYAMTITISHIGITVLFLYPIPNWRTVPSLLNIKLGFTYAIIPNSIINNSIESEVIFCLINSRFMVILCFINIDFLLIDFYTSI
jgi:hypothetical protein